jgi:hypothetical protein
MQSSGWAKSHVKYSLPTRQWMQLFPPPPNFHRVSVLPFSLKGSKADLSKTYQSGHQQASKCGGGRRRHSLEWIEHRKNVSMNFANTAVVAASQMHSKQGR